jgi:N-acyl-L-homoserine lactone synthetase
MSEDLSDDDPIAFTMKSLLADTGDATFRLNDSDSTDFKSVVINLLIGMLEAAVLKQNVEFFFKFSRSAEDTFLATGMKVWKLGDDSNLLGTTVAACEFEFRIDTIGLLCVVSTTSGFKT